MEHAEFLRVLSRTMAEMSNADVNEGTRSSLFQIADEIDRLRRERDGLRANYDKACDRIMRMDARAEEWANELAELRAIVERLSGVRSR